MTMMGELEPSSIVTFLIPARRQMRSPTSRLPVKGIFLTRRSATRASPISPPGPVRHWIPSGGSPASSRISVSFRADSGVSVAGLLTTALPAARAAPPLVDDLALLRRDEPSHFFVPRLDELRRLFQDFPALVAGQPRHRAGAPRCALEGPVHIRRLPARHGIDDGVVVRVQ